MRSCFERFSLVNKRCSQTSKFLTSEPEPCKSHIQRKKCFLLLLTLFFGIAQLHHGPGWHAAHDAGSGLHLHRVHEHQEPGVGEGAAAQRGAACCRRPELGPVGFQVHREPCSARGSLWAHKCPGQGQWKCSNGERSKHKAWRAAFLGQLIKLSVFWTTHLETQEIQLGKLALDQELLFHALCLGFHAFDDYNQSCWSEWTTHDLTNQPLQAN